MRFFRAFPHIRIDSDGGQNALTVATVSDFTGDELPRDQVQEAYNMALAAPELLEALKLMLSGPTMQQAEGGLNIEDVARAAIAKATGGAA